MRVKLLGYNNRFGDAEEFINTKIIKNIKDFFDKDQKVVVLFNCFGNNVTPKTIIDIVTDDEDFKEDEKVFVIAPCSYHSSGHRLIEGVERIISENNIDGAMFVPDEYQKNRLVGETPIILKEYGEVASFCKVSPNVEVIYTYFSMYTNSGGRISAFMKRFLEEICFNRVPTDIIKTPKYIEEMPRREDVKAKFNSIDSVCSKFASEYSISALKEEMLGKVDIVNMTKLINESLRTSYSGIFCKPDMVKSWLNDWADRKWKFYLLFGKQFYISENIELELDEVLFRQEVDGLCHKYPKYAMMLSAFEGVEYAHNKIMNTSRGRKVLSFYPAQKNMKLSKYISSLCNDRDLDIDLSMIMQNKKMSGQIRISIDPMDYLMSSISKHGWRSCHHFINGERKGGPMSFMFDSSTVVAYMTNGRTYDYVFVKDTFSGNSKQWRQLVSIGTDTNAMIFCREYPQDYFNGNLSKKVRLLLESVISGFTDSDNRYTVFKNGARNNGYVNCDGTLHYDDIPARETFYVNHISIGNGKRVPIKIGSRVKCPICGKNYVAGGNQIVCNSCIKQSMEKCRGREEDLVF